MDELIKFIILIGLGYFVGTRVEKKHYASICAREKMTLCLPVVAGEDIQEDKPVNEARLVHGSVVVSTDYFKLMLAGLRNIIGGEVSAYETLLDRGRREAILRMKESAQGADIILNMRIETCQVALAGSIEVLAYGTAVYYKK